MQVELKEDDYPLFTIFLLLVTHYFSLIKLIIYIENSIK